MVVNGWEEYRGFSGEARNAFWPLLQRVLRSPAAPENGELASAFQEVTGLQEHSMIAALQSCEFLVREACSLNLDVSKFQADLEALSDGDLHEAQVILSQYEEMKRQLRAGSYHRSLSDHGKLLVGLNWRVDRVVSSDRGTELDSEVVFMTLQYQEGDDVDRVSLQLTPHALKDLKRFCAQF